MPEPTDSTKLAAGAPGHDVTTVGALVVALRQAIKVCRLHGLQHVQTQHCLDALRSSFAAVWTAHSTLRLLISADRIAWDGVVVHCSGAPQDRQAEGLAFVFYKDGIRELVFRLGFETEEYLHFVDLVAQSQRAESDEVAAGEDDLVTLLWQGNFSFLEVGSVEVLQDERGQPIFVDEDADVTQLLALALGTPPPGEKAGQPADLIGAPIDPAGLPPDVVARPISPAELKLEADEKQYLHIAIEKELGRDVALDVVNALLDVFEDQDSAIQGEIVRIFERLVLTFLTQGRVDLAGQLLAQARTIAAKERGLDAERRAALRATIERIAAHKQVAGFLKSVAAGDVFPELEPLRVFVENLGTGCLDVVLHGAESGKVKQVRDVLHAAAMSITGANQSVLSRLLASTDPLIVRGALRLVNKSDGAGILESISKLLRHDDVRLRLSATEALIRTGSPLALDRLVPALNDAAAEVRVAAAWALGAWQHENALTVLRNILSGPAIVASGLAEKTALFEAYARIGRKDAVPLLAEILLKRSLLSPKYAPEMRQSAARALGLVRGEDARAALKAAARDRDPRVQRKVSRALSKGAKS